MGRPSSPRRNAPSHKASPSIDGPWTRASTSTSSAPRSSRYSESTTDMLNGKVVVVTGGAGLLGRRFCNEIAHQGGTAIVADVNLAPAQAIASEIQGAGGRAAAFPVDITNAASVERLIDSVRAAHGRIDAVVNNAYPRNKSWGRKLEDV